MTGGIIYVNHIPSAFTLGEPLTADTFDVHFEKADDSIDGIYPMINQSFVTHELQRSSLKYSMAARRRKMPIKKYSIKNQA